MALHRDILFRYSTNIQDINKFLMDVTKANILISLKIIISMINIHFIISLNSHPK